MQAKNFADRQKLQEKVQDLQRQLEHKTAAEHGEGAELDLFEELKKRFEPMGDVITRVPKGTPGADVVHLVKLNGLECGKIVYDSKNRAAWQTVYATKLRSDMIAEHAEHAVLSTNKFPLGAGKQLHPYEGVILACPARVVAVAEILRSHVVQTHMLRLSNEQRAEKTAALYAFITSERCGQLMDSLQSDIEKLEDIDVAEKKAHDSVWEKRGRVIKGMEKTRGSFIYEVGRIVGTAEAAE